MSCGCEAACGQQLRIVGAPTRRCQTRPRVLLNAQFLVVFLCLFVFFLKAVSSAPPG